MASLSKEFDTFITNYNIHPEQWYLEKDYSHACSGRGKDKVSEWWFFELCKEKELPSRGFFFKATW
jgi:hypothetical protein